uniref:protein SOGA3a isoform X2 n=1 Tax=Pristiophorus japonicus TaxID=55135 RepID=UPI00398E7BDE
MWNVVGHGAGTYGGGCASGVPGWEYVLQSREKGRGRERSRSPLRNMPTSAGFEDLKQGGSVPVSPYSTQPDKYELQYQLFRLRRKFEEVKKHYRQDKEVWVKEKEMLLREVAEIQAGENRRILLELRSILQGVQAEIKKEEDHRAELQRQYSSDKYAWELERAELKCRIGQIYWDVNSRQECKLNGQANGQRQRKTKGDDWVLLNLHASSLECNESQDEKVQNHMNCARALGAVMEDVTLNDTDRGIGKSTSDPLFIEELSLESLEEGGSSQNSQNTENDKKKYSSALNAALQEIAKVSEELCSYQEEIQKKVNHRRTKSISYLQEYEKKDENTFLRNETSSDENSCVSNDIFKALSPTLTEYQKCSEELHNEKNWNHSNMDGHGISPGLSGGDGVNDVSPPRKTAPPVPPRTSSWYFASSFSVFPQDHEDAVKEDNSNYKTQNHNAGKSCNSPYVVRKFEAMLQENEQKSFIDGRLFGTLAPQIKCDMGPKYNKNNNHSRWSCDVTKFGLGTENKYFDSAVKPFSSDKNLMLPMQEKSRGPNSIRGLQQTKSLSPKSNPSECNFSSTSKTTGVCNTSGVFVESTLDVPSTQTSSFRKTALNTESCDPVAYGKSVELPQNETSTCPGSSFSLHSAGNVHATRQFSSKHTGSAFRPYMSSSMTNTKIAGQDKHSNGFPDWLADGDKRHMFDKVDLIPNNVSSPTRSPYARSNFDIVQTMLRNNEKPSSPSFQVKKKVVNFADGRTKQQTFHSGSLHENPNKIAHLFQILHLDQEKQEIRRKSGPSQWVSGQQATLPVTVPPVTMRLNGVSFSRPARPQNRRLPSRWATRSPSAPAILNRAAQKHYQAFLFDIKTSII